MLSVWELGLIIDTSHLTSNISSTVINQTNLKFIELDKVLNRMDGESAYNSMLRCIESKIKDIEIN